MAILRRPSGGPGQGHRSRQRVPRSCSCTAAWAAPASGGRCSRCGRGVSADRGGRLPRRPWPRRTKAKTLDDYADQVHAVVNHVGSPVHLIGFSWGGGDWTAYGQVPQAEHSVIEGAGHMMPLTHAPELARILVAAVASAQQSSAAKH